MASETNGSAKGKRRGRVLLVTAGLLLVLAGGAGAAWFSGMLTGLIPGASAEAAGDAPRPAVFVEVPDIITNLNGTARRQSFVKLRARLEVNGPENAVATQAAMPRLLDMFNTYLRETRPEELRGSAGMHRLREELVARANVAIRPGAVNDVLFVEMVVQ